MSEISTQHQNLKNLLYSFDCYLISVLLFILIKLYLKIYFLDFSKFKSIDVKF